MRQPSVERRVGTSPIFLVTRRQADVSAFAPDAQIGWGGGQFSLITMMLGSFFFFFRSQTQRQKILPPDNQSDVAIRQIIKMNSFPHHKHPPPSVGKAAPTVRQGRQVDRVREQRTCDVSERPHPTPSPTLGCLFSVALRSCRNDFYTELGGCCLG